MSTRGSRFAPSHAYLTATLVRRHLKIKYKGTSLGVLWSLGHPLMLLGVYVFAFRIVLAVQIERYPLFLILGVLAWSFTSEALYVGATTIVENGPLLRKIAFPRSVLPVATVLAIALQFLLAAVLLTPLLWLLGLQLTAAALALPAIMALHGVFVIGMTYASCTAHTYYRDTRHLLTVVVGAWFWLTPIVYSPELVPEPYSSLMVLNPMAAFVEAYRTVAMSGTWPPPLLLARLVTMSTATWIVGRWIFSRHQGRFAELV